MRERSVGVSYSTRSSRPGVLFGSVRTDVPRRAHAGVGSEADSVAECGVVRDGVGDGGEEGGGRGRGRVSV